jgi:hypothetical protein
MIVKCCTGTIGGVWKVEWTYAISKIQISGLGISSYEASLAWYLFSQLTCAPNITPLTSEGINKANTAQRDGGNPQNNATHTYTSFTKPTSMTLSIGTSRLAIFARELSRMNKNAFRKNRRTMFVSALTFICSFPMM